MFKPLRSNVLLKAQEHQEHASGLIIASPSANDATVVAIGAEVKELKLGDRVRYDKSSASVLDGYLMCREADILCIVE